MIIFIRLNGIMEIEIMLIKLTAAPTSVPSPSSLCSGHTCRIWTNINVNFDDDDDNDDDDDDYADGGGNLLKELKSVTTDEV